MCIRDRQIPIGNYGNTDENEDPYSMVGPAELPVKLELRYAIEAKRAEKGLEMPITQNIHRRVPREVGRRYISSFKNIVNNTYFFSFFFLLPARHNSQGEKHRVVDQKVKSTKLKIRKSFLIKKSV